jgi:hypothetical protein
LKEKLQKNTFTLYSLEWCGRIGLSEEQLNHHITMNLEIKQAIQDRLDEERAALTLTPSERYMLHPEAAYGGDGPWNNYGGDGAPEPRDPVVYTPSKEDAFVDEDGFPLF